ncbi:MAG: uracil-DNA glycosylase [Hyphomicrobiaceae bacterium]|nr:uracil-DNA glycosylase [Hyphomicrobiaceae bacterium]
MGATGVYDAAPTDWHGRAAPGAAFVWPETSSKKPAGPPRGHPRSAQAQPVATVPPVSPQSLRSPTVQHGTSKPAPLRTFDPLPGRPRPAVRPNGDASGLPSASSLQELGRLLQAFDGCGLKATAKNLVLFRGAERARIMIIGEAPGREEDAAGKPFVGAAGQLLDRMLAAIGLTELDVHIANVVYWRPPGNRNPTPMEVAACAPFLEQQIALVEPEFLFVLGGIAAKHILDTDEGITRIRGQWREIDLRGRRFKVLPSLHPAYLLRSPAAKRQAWRDLLALRSALDGSGA